MAPTKTTLVWSVSICPFFTMLTSFSARPRHTDHEPCRSAIKVCLPSKLSRVLISSPSATSGREKEGRSFGAPAKAVITAPPKRISVAAAICMVAGWRQEAHAVRLCWDRVMVACVSHKSCGARN